MKINKAVAAVLSLLLLVFMLSACFPWVDEPYGAKPDTEDALQSSDSITDGEQEADGSVTAEQSKNSDSSYEKSTDDDIREPSFLTYVPVRVWYEQLNAAQKEAYCAIYNEIFEHPEKISIPKLSKDELKELYDALIHDNPHMLCLANTYRYGSNGSGMYFYPNYRCKKSECDARTKKMLASAEIFVENVDSETDAFEKELGLHNQLVFQTEYRFGEDDHTAYGPLVNREAVCGGYTLAYKLLLDMAGINSVYITGRSVNGKGDSTHAWNCVQIGDDWYFVDVTWDDSGDDSDTELVYTYFNVSEKEIAATHYDYQLPKGIHCTKNDNNYYVRYHSFCTEDNWEDTITFLLGCMEELPYRMEFRMESQSLYQRVTKYLFEEKKLFDMIHELFPEGLSENGYSYRCYYNDEMYDIRLIIREKE